MHCAILSIGDEVVQGRILDTNAPWIAQQLDDAGMTCTHMVTVSDAQADIEAALTRCCKAADLVLTTGGLGPTDDDRTRDALCAVAGERVERDTTALAALTARLERVGSIDFESARRSDLDWQRAASCAPWQTGISAQNYN